jgi:hypothetical protein
MAKKEKQVKVSFTYDRLGEQKLSQAFHLLVPAGSTDVSIKHCINELTEKASLYENSSHIHEGILRSPEGE